MIYDLLKEDFALSLSQDNNLSNTFIRVIKVAESLFNETVSQKKHKI